MIADGDEFIRLRDVVAVMFPHGGMTVAGLRREAKRGRLAIYGGALPPPVYAVIKSLETTLAWNAHKAQSERGQQ